MAANRLNLTKIGHLRPRDSGVLRTPASPVLRSPSSCMPRLLHPPSLPQDRHLHTNGQIVPRCNPSPTAEDTVAQDSLADDPSARHLEDPVVPRSALYTALASLGHVPAALTGQCTVPFISFRMSPCFLFWIIRSPFHGYLFYFCAFPSLP